MKRIYLDHAATTLMKEEVIAEVLRMMQENYGNPSSIHQFGRQAKMELMEARQTIARLIGSKEDEIIFTSGGTEGDNTAIIQTALSKKAKGTTSSQQK